MKLFDMTEHERRAMGDKGRRLLEERFTWLLWQPATAPFIRGFSVAVRCPHP